MGNKQPNSDTAHQVSKYAFTEGELLHIKKVYDEMSDGTQKSAYL